MLLAVRLSKDVAFVNITKYSLLRKSVHSPTPSYVYQLVFKQNLLLFLLHKNRHNFCFKFNCRGSATHNNRVYNYLHILLYNIAL